MDAFVRNLWNPGLVGEWLLPLAIGLTVMLAAWVGVRGTASLFDPVRRRLSDLRGAETDGIAPAAPAGRVPGWLRRLEPRNQAKLGGLRRSLRQAGFGSARAVGTLYAIKLAVCAGTVGGAWATLLAVPALRAIPVAAIVFLGIATLVGWLLPNAAVERIRAARQGRLMAGLPDALDLLVACTEAGLGLNAALERVVEQLPASHPELAEELGMVNAEIRAGVDRTEALRNLAERSGMEEIRGLVTLMSHSARLGTGIAGTLRIYAEEFRDRRMQRAEEQAAMVGTRMIFPLVACLWPAFFIVATGPAIVGVMRALAGVQFAGSGQ